MLEKEDQQLTKKSKNNINLTETSKDELSASSALLTSSLKTDKSIEKYLSEAKEEDRSDFMMVYVPTTRWFTNLLTRNKLSSEKYNGLSILIS